MMFETDSPAETNSGAPRTGPVPHAEWPWWQRALDESRVASSSLNDLLDAAARRAPTLTAAEGSCGISVMVAHAPGWIHGYSADAAGALDIMQFAVEEGPCLDALATGRSWYIPDLETETRWPIFTLPAKLYETSSVFVQPLILSNGRAIGTLTLYSSRRAACSIQERREVADFAAVLARMSSRVAELGRSRDHPAKSVARAAFETIEE